MAPAQGAIPGILRFGTKNSNKGGWRGGYSELGGGAWPPGFPSRPNLGLCFPWPCLLSFTPSLSVPPRPPFLEDWEPLAKGEEPQEVPWMLPCRGDCSVLHLGLPPGPSGAPALAEGRASYFWLRALCLLLGLSPTPRVLGLSPPALSVFPWPCLPVPISPCQAGSGAHHPSVDHSPFRTAGSLPLVGVGLICLPPLLPLHPSLSLISPLARLPHLSLS